MHDHWLIAIALTVSALGIIALLILQQHMELEEHSIDEMRTLQPGTPVRMRASVSDIQSRGNITVLALEQPMTIEGILFAPVDIDTGSCVLVSGKTDAYNGKKQILISRIREC